MLQTIRRLLGNRVAGEQQPVIQTMVGMLPKDAPLRQTFTQRVSLDYFRGWVYAAIDMNARQVAAIPLRLYVRERGGQEKLYRTRHVNRARKRYLLGDANHSPSATVLNKLMSFGDDFTEVTESHPASDLLRKVNPWLGGFDLLTLTVQYAEACGNWYWWPNMDTGVPSEIWCIRPDQVNIIPDRERFIAGYRFGESTGSPIDLTPDELLHGKYPNPGNYWYGLGKVEAGWGAIQKEKAAQQMDLSTFENNARPDYAVVIKNMGAGTKNLDEYNRLINEQLRGVKKSGKMFVMTGDVQLTPLSFAPKDLTGREETLEEIAAVMGVPITLLKANDPNLASAQVGYASWRENTILPICRRIEDFLNQRYLPLWGIGDDACFAFDDPVPKNRSEDREDARLALSMGRITLNEDRVSQGLDPYETPLADEPLYNGQPLGTSASPFGFGGPSGHDRSGPKDQQDTGDSEGGTQEDSGSDGEPEEKAADLAGVLAVLKAASAGEVATTAVPSLLELAGVDRDQAGTLAKAAVPVDPIRAMVDAHNAACPGGEVTYAEAIRKAAESRPTLDDMAAELLSIVKAGMGDGMDDEIERLVKAVTDEA